MTIRAHFDSLEAATSAAEMQGRIASCLSAQAGENISITELHVPRVMPRKTGDVLIQYHVYNEDSRSGATHEIMYGTWYPDGGFPSGASDPLHKGVHDFEDLGLRLWLFPSDPKLPHISTLINAEQFPSVYGEALSSAGITAPHGEQATEILGYRLSRRFVVRLAWQESNMPAGAAPIQLVAKMCRPKQALSLWTRHRQLEHECLELGTGHDVFLPRQLLIEKNFGVVFQTAEQGQNLHQMTKEPSFVDGCVAAMNALKSLQRFRIAGLARFTAADELGHLEWLVQTTSATFPDVESDLVALLRDLKVQRPDDSAKPVVCHRDFYDKQILCDGDRVVLLDYDTLSEADGALDIGNFIAHLHWRTRQDPAAGSNLVSAEQAIWDMLDPHDSDLITRVSWWAAAARLRLACIYLWRPRWRAETHAFITDLARADSRVGAESGEF